MKRLRLFWQLNLTYLTLTLLALSSASYFFFHAAENHVNSLFEQARYEESQRIRRFISENIDLELGRRVAIVNTLSGAQLEMDEHQDSRFSGRAQRFPEQLRIPATNGEQLTYVVSAVTTQRENVVNVIKVRLLQVGLLTTVVLVLLSGLLSRRFSAPIGQLVEGTKLLAAGDLDYRLPHGSYGEVGILAENFNLMSTQLKTYFHELMSERETLGSLFHDMAHQIKTPLATIRMYTELLMEEGTDANTANRFFEQIRNQVSHLQRLSNTLIQLSRLEAGTGGFTMKETNLVDTVKQAVSTLQPSAVAKGLAIRTKYDVNELILLHDCFTMQQALENILENAIKFTPAGTVTVHVFTFGEACAVRIMDTGVGIKQDEVDRVFRRFYQGTSGKQHSNNSCGLGLAIAKAIVEGHGGTIQIGSTEGEGTFVTIIFRSRPASGT